MQYGKIVAVRGANISLFIQAEEEQQVIDTKENLLRHLEVMLPAYNKLTVDLAVEHLGQAIGFSTIGGKIWFPQHGVNERVEPKAQK